MPIPRTIIVTFNIKSIEKNLGKKLQNLKTITKSKTKGGILVERITRAKAIRLKCLDCSGGSTKEVRLCAIKSCALYRFRMGKEDHDQLYQETFNFKK